MWISSESMYCGHVYPSPSVCVIKFVQFLKFIMLYFILFVLPLFISWYDYWWRTRKGRTVSFAYTLTFILYSILFYLFFHLLSPDLIIGEEREKEEQLVSPYTLKFIPVHYSVMFPPHYAYKFHHYVSTRWMHAQHQLRGYHIRWVLPATNYYQCLILIFLNKPIFTLIFSVYVVVSLCACIL